MLYCLHIMKRKCFKILLLLFISAAFLPATAQKDTTFSFYFNVDKHTADTAQQKAFETFLQTVARITTIYGYTDTTGPWPHNAALAQRRAIFVYNLLPKTLQSGVTLSAEGETKEATPLWKNRRAVVTAIIKANNTLTTIATTPTEIPVNDTATELAIEPILFIPDQALLTDESTAYMQTLARQLQQYTGARFHIVGHVNYQSNLPPERLKDLYELSEKRARAVYDVLVQNGIAPNRMTYKGVGNSEPVIANPVNEAEKRRNMRVQLFVIRN